VDAPVPADGLIVGMRPQVAVGYCLSEVSPFVQVTKASSRVPVDQIREKLEPPDSSDGIVTYVDARSPTVSKVADHSATGAIRRSVSCLRVISSRVSPPKKSNDQRGLNTVRYYQL
jgi:hypothetical protein